MQDSAISSLADTMFKPATSKASCCKWICRLVLEQCPKVGQTAHYQASNHSVSTSSVLYEKHPRVVTLIYVHTVVLLYSAARLQKHGHGFSYPGIPSFDVCSGKADAASILIRSLIWVATGPVVPENH